jgi:hypothetical protein
MSESLSEVGAAPAVAEPEVPAASEPVVDDTLAAGAAAGAATDGTVEAPAAPEAPTVDPAELQAELEYTRAQLAELADYLQQQPQQQQQQQPVAGQPDLSGFVDEFGQLTPEGLLQALAVQQQAIERSIDERFRQIAEPMQAQREAEAYQAGLASAQDMLGDNIARLGEFASDPAADQIARERVLDRAEALMPEIQQRFGSNPRAAEIAIQRAADEERQYLNSVRGQGAAQATNRLATLAGAASEPGNGATGAVAGVPEFKSPQEVVQYYAAQARAIEQNPGGAAA